MIKVQAEGLGKRFNREWIYRSLNLHLHTGEAWAITGPNGSGKSTLLQNLAGYTFPTEGRMTYTMNEQVIAHEQFYQHISLVAPYQELIEELSLIELLHFHFQFKPALEGLQVEEMIEKMYLEKARHKYIRHFSSGMKQRLKLGLAFFSNSPVLFLDEPTNNLDHKGIDWYQEQLHKALKDRLVLICSNQPYEYEVCNQSLNIIDHKPVFS
jgi:ABC-type multidrug transport system ATPase subunit